MDGTKQQADAKNLPLSKLNVTEIIAMTGDGN
jgi:hypothetical protein